MNATKVASFRQQEVGIDSFFGEHPGFTAKFQRHSYDFVVRELDANNIPVKMEKPCTPHELFTMSQSTAPSEHMWFTVAKQKQTTPEAISKLAQIFQAPTKSFSFCGMKDRWGITTQQISFPCGALLEPCDQLSSLALADASPQHFKARLGGHGGNEFVVVLRHVNLEEEADAIETSLAAWERGFPNYFGMQRFGTGTLPTSQMGLALLQGNFQHLVQLLLGSRARRGTTLQAYLEASQGNFSAALALMPASCALETTDPPQQHILL